MSQARLYKLMDVYLIDNDIFFFLECKVHAWPTWELKAAGEQKQI